MVVHHEHIPLCLLHSCAHHQHTHYYSLTSYSNIYSPQHICWAIASELRDRGLFQCGKTMREVLLLKAGIKGLLGRSQSSTPRSSTGFYELFLWYLQRTSSEYQAMQPCGRHCRTASHLCPSTFSLPPERHPAPSCVLAFFHVQCVLFYVMVTDLFLMLNIVIPARVCLCGEGTLAGERAEKNPQKTILMGKECECEHRSLSTLSLPLLHSPFHPHKSRASS